MRRLIIVLVIIAALLLISPLLTGKMAEKELKAESQRLPQYLGLGSLVELNEVDYDRGWFASDTNHKVVVQETIRGNNEARGRPSPEVLLETEIMHGPMIVGGKDSNLPAVSVAVAISKTTFRVKLDDSDEYFEIPGALYNRVDLTGGGKLWGVIDNIDHTFTEKNEEIEFVWGGGQFEMNYNADQSEVHSIFESEPLMMGFADGAGQMGKAYANSKATKANFGLWTGSYESKIDGMSATGQAGQIFSVDQVKFDGSTEMVGEDRLSANMIFAMEKIDTPVLSNTNFSMPFELAGLDAESLGEFQSMMESGTGNPEDATLMMLEAQELFGKIFQRGFGVSVPGMSVATEHGTATLDFDFELPESAMSGQAALMAAATATGNAELRVDRSLVEFAAQFNPQLQQQVAGMVQAGFLTEDGDALVMIAGYEGGLLTVNGLPIPLPIPGG